MHRIKFCSPLAGLLILIMLVTMFYANQKSGMFIDEIYTYGLSNGYYTPFITSIHEDGTVDQILTQQDLMSYLTISDDDDFAFGSVYYNQSQDVHPPLHYWIIHIFSSFFQSSYSKWIGIIPNIIFLLTTCVILYALVKKSFNNEWIALMGVALYGLSTIAISTAIMIRMYMLLTLLTVLLAYWILHILREPKLYHYIWVTVTIFLGLLTQYYFVFYAFFVCVACDLFLLCKKRWKDFTVFSVCALGGVTVFALFYPACFDHLFAEKLVSGSTMIENLLVFEDYFRRLHCYVYSINFFARVAVRTGILAIIACLPMIKRVFDYIRARQISLYHAVLFIPSFIALVVVAIVSPVIPLRYAYNLIPIFVYTVCYVVFVVFSVYDDKFKFIRNVKKLVVPIVTLVSLIVVFQVPPEYLYTEHLNYNRVIEKYTDGPCIYFNDNYVSPLTQDLLQLVQFDEVFVTNDPASVALHDYLTEQPEKTQVVVYIDVDSEWSSGFDSEKILSFMSDRAKYDDIEQLYQYGSSEVYLLTKNVH